MSDDLDRRRDGTRAKVLWIAISAATWLVVGVFLWRSDTVPVPIVVIGIAQLLIGLIDLGARKLEADDLPGARSLRVRYLEEFGTIDSGASYHALAHALARWPEQPIIPVLDAAGELCGLIEVDVFREVLPEPGQRVADLMRSPVAIGETGDPGRAMALYDLRAVPIIDRWGRVTRLAVGGETVATPAERARREREPRESAGRARN